MTLQIFANSKIELYFNGNLVATLDVKLSLAGFKAEKIFLFPFFQGEVTELRIWQKTLDAKAIREG